VREVQAAVLGVAPVKGPPLKVTEVVWPAAGALRVPLAGVAANDEETMNVRVKRVSQKAVYLFTCSLQGKITDRGPLARVVPLLAVVQISVLDGELSILVACCPAAGLNYL